MISTYLYNRPFTKLSLGTKVPMLNQLRCTVHSDGRACIQTRTVLLDARETKGGWVIPRYLPKILSIPQARSNVREAVLRGFRLDPACKPTKAPTVAPTASAGAAATKRKSRAKAEGKSL